VKKLRFFTVGKGFKGNASSLCITNIGLKYVKQSLFLNPFFLNLENLSLCDNFCVTNDGLKYLKKLTCLDISANFPINNQGLIYLISLNKLYICDYHDKITF